MSSRKGITEAEVRKAIQKALKTMLKEIENEPKLVIETSSDIMIENSTQLENVLDWLFRRRETNDY
jgi:rhamnogalacturonyl hydrolase YesR